MPHHRKLIFSGTAGRPLANRICEKLSVPHGKMNIERFKDGEVWVQFQENIRDADVFIVNPSCPPAENILEMRLLASAARQSAAKTITLVIPYLGYNRQDRKDAPRVSISAREVCEILSHNVDRVLLFDIHSGPTEGFFSEGVVINHLYGSPTVVPYLKTIAGENFVVASTDVGGSKRARAYARHLGSDDIVIFDKVRPKPGVVDGKSIKIIGSVEGKDVIFVDDMVDSGGTLCEDAKKAKEAGAQRLIACATHGLLSGNAVELLDKSPLDELVITDTIPHKEEVKGARIKITTLSVDWFLAQAIQRIHDGESLSELIQ